jgi:hypothetical protein
VLLPVVLLLVLLSVRPASWSGGQSVWLLTMRSRVGFPALPCAFFSLNRKNVHGDHGLGS